MRHSPFTAVYDACVLYPAPLRDFLMWQGLSGRFRARWSQAILEEWKRNLLIEVDRYLNILLRQGLVQTTKALATYRSIL